MRGSPVYILKTLSLLGKKHSNFLYPILILNNQSHASLQYKKRKCFTVNEAISTPNTLTLTLLIGLRPLFDLWQRLVGKTTGRNSLSFIFFTYLARKKAQALFFYNTVATFMATVRNSLHCWDTLFLSKKQVELDQLFSLWRSYPYP